MFPKAVVVVVMYFCFNTFQVANQLPVKASIEIEGEVQNLSVKANLHNYGNKAISLSYILEVKKKGRTGYSNTLQKGALVAVEKRITTLSESRMNLSKSDELMAKLLIYHDYKIVAQDSVVFHGDNH